MEQVPVHRWSPHDLVYCSNVHPAPELDAVNRVIAREVTPVRELRGLERMGMGMWLSARAAAELHRRPGALLRTKDQLGQSGLAVFTLNGFPYGDFHGSRVKEKVYRPDWSEPQRLGYTMDLARILASFLPTDYAEGTISTLPLGFAPTWDRERHRSALTALCHLAEELAELRASTGRHIRVCLEMEPGCVLERTEQIIELFTTQLPAAASALGAEEKSLTEHLGACLDVCHQAVMFEHPGDSLSRLSEAGIAVGKIQISSALELPRPAANDPSQVLTPFSEPRYLHQVRTRGPQGLHGTMDLDDALRLDDLSRDAPWRIHFHVPIQTDNLENSALATTQWAIGEVLDFLSSDPDYRPHLEVETYTWQVLPPHLRPSDPGSLRLGLAGELRWLEHEMRGRGLLE